MVGGLLELICKTLVFHTNMAAEAVALHIDQE